jgi:hypothetical protein
MLPPMEVVPLTLLELEGSMDLLNVTIVTLFGTISHICVWRAGQHGHRAILVAPGGCIMAPE